MPGMRRREFVSLFGGAAATWPLAARAQQPERVRQIGVLMTGRVNAQLRMDAIQQGLQKLGWAVGHSVRIEYRWAVGDAEMVRAFAKELVDNQPDIVVAQGSTAVQALLPGNSHHSHRVRASHRSGRSRLSPQAWRIQAVTSPASAFSKNRWAASGSRS